jgi:hypothetical protein
MSGSFSFLSFLSFVFNSCAGIYIVFYYHVARLPIARSGWGECCHVVSSLIYPPFCLLGIKAGASSWLHHASVSIIYYYNEIAFVFVTSFL